MSEKLSGKWFLNGPETYVVVVEMDKKNDNSLKYYSSILQLMAVLMRTKSDNSRILVLLTL